MVTRLTGCGTDSSPSRKDALFGASLTLGAALLVAAIMVIGRSPLTESIGMVMFPGVMAIGYQSMKLRGHSVPARVVLLGGQFLILFLIGLVAGLASSA